MGGKRLKEKVGKEVGEGKVELKEEDKEGGDVMNYELEGMEGVGLGEGVMGGLICGKNVLGDEGGVKEIEEEWEGGIGECYLGLIEMGLWDEDGKGGIIKGE